ncbi:MAG TPA: hypothetical protein VK914_05830 [bacterium]|jgi:hypothetical protein|nr:hypothetical protein [bacterium]
MINLNDMSIRVRTNFKKNLDSVRSLVNFDTIVIDYALEIVMKLHERLKANNQNPAANGENDILALQNIQNHHSLESRYGTIRNQCVVLLVSHFGSAVKDVFTGAFDIAVREKKLGAITSESLKVTVEELASLNFKEHGSWAWFYLKKSESSFQDMKSIKRLFENAFGINIDKNEDVDNLIFGQSARHAIVHNAGIIDESMISQISGAKQRKLKLDISSGELLNFSKDDIEILMTSMQTYIDVLFSKINAIL